MAHTVNRRHAPVGASTRASHGAQIDPTGTQFAGYGLDMEPTTQIDILGQIDGDLIVDGSIGQQHLAALAVLNAALADNAVAQRNLQDLAVGTNELQALSVSADKIQSNAVITRTILAGAVTADHINADGLRANQITSGTLSVGGLPGTPDYLRVFNSSGVLLFEISETHIIAIDGDNPDNAVRIAGGVLSFSSNFSVGESLATWSTALSAAGLRADAIQVGIAPGGHNLVPNSSFENTPYSATLSKKWPTDFAWNTALAVGGLNAINMDTSGASLQLTTATF